MVLLRSFKARQRLGDLPSRGLRRSQWHATSVDPENSNVMGDALLVANVSSGPTFAIIWHKLANGVILTVHLRRIVSLR
jgi:hypothetical protein